MSERNGGTKMYCPGCKKITVCKAIPLSQIGEKSRRLWYKCYNDLQLFRRARECLKCHHVFLTSEIDEKILDELLILRKLEDIKNNVQEYIKEDDPVRSLEKIEKINNSLDDFKIFLR
jgi:hypothetical protein